MSNTWGTSLTISIFGESHGPAIGVIIGGLPPGVKIDMTKVDLQMKRRAPGQNAWSTKRSETDEVTILSGLHDSLTTGAPLCGLIHNRDARSRDYSTLLRPGHADLAALYKYGGYADMRGGGHFSGRLTAPLVFAGAIARQVLALKNIWIGGRITQIGTISDLEAPCEIETYRSAMARPFPAFGEAAAAQMMNEIEKARQDNDSVGGIVEAAALGLPAGLGEPFFDSVESLTAHLIFSIPAIKGIEFGSGFKLATMRGSEANDPIALEQSGPVVQGGKSGGILGGITTGAPLVVRAAVKPTPSISKPQQTVDSKTHQEAELCIGGRHDPCVTPRALPAIEAALSLCLLDLILLREGNSWTI